MITYSLWRSIVCDDDGSTSSVSAFMGSQVALKTDAGEANPATYQAREPAVFWCHVLIIALVPEFSATAHLVISLLFADHCTTMAL